MTANKPNRSFVAIFAFSLLLSFSYSVAARSRVATTANVTPAAFQNPAIYPIKDAGLQFEAPKGWKVETTDGNVVLSVADGALSVTLLVEDDYEQAMTGMKSALKEKLTELKPDGERKTETHNGMIHIEEAGTGLMKGVKITWSIDVLKAARNVTILTFGIDSVFEAHSEEYLKFVTSLKKI